MLDFAKDLNTVAACNAGAEIELTHPADKNRRLGVFIKIVGQDSDAFNEYVEQSADADRNREYEFRKKGQPVPPKRFSEDKQTSMDTIISCIMGWRTASQPADERTEQPALEGGDYILFQGEQMKFSVSNAKKLFATSPFVKVQLDKAIMDYANFIKS